MTATRVMRARRPGMCPLCGQLVTVGQQIGRTPVGWCHTSCIIEAVHKMTPAARRGDPCPR
jgi:hypothetical protein